MIIIDGYAIDMCMSIKPSFKGHATSHPIENNSAITDHVIDDPDMLTLEDCVVTNTPAGDMVALRAREIGTPIQNAFNKLISLRTANPRVAFSVQTDHRTYTDMVLLEFSPIFNAAAGRESMRFTLVLQKITTVTNDRVFVKVSSPTASAVNNRGNKAGKKPPDNAANAKDDKNQSLLWQIIH